MLAQRLKECRKTKGVTQKDVAEFLSMTTMSYQKYELALREPNIDKLNKLADYFGVSVDYLLGRVNYLVDVDGRVTVKTPLDIFNLDTDEQRKNLVKTN